MYSPSHSLSLCLIAISCLFALSSAQECQPEIQCSGRGICINVVNVTTNSTSWSCLCDDGWTTHPMPNATTVDAIYCNYERKEQLVAFLLSFFLGLFAAGRFYCGLWLTAGLKIGLNIGLGCFGMCCVSCITGVSAFGSMGSGNRRSSDGCCGKLMGALGCCYVFLVSLATFAWLVADWVLFGLNKIPDSNGVDLQPW